MPLGAPGARRLSDPRAGRPRTNPLIAASACPLAGGLPAVGTLYLQRLAHQLANAVITPALNRDASRVVVLTVPDVTVTPRFLDVLAGVALQVDSQPGALPGAGEAAAAGVKTLVNAWV